MTKLFIIPFLTFLILAGCSANQDSGEKNQPAQNLAGQGKVNDSNAEETINGAEESQKGDFFTNLIDIPQDSADLVNQPAGPFGDRELDLEEEERQKVVETIKDMPVMPENATEEDYDTYFRYAYTQVAGDFSDPEDLVNKWEFAMSGNPDLSNGKYQFKENYNIEVILDSSGSMANMIGGTTMMDLAKEAITDFLSSAPEDANVSLRVYGHKGTGSDADKKMSCSSIEQLYGYGKYNEAEFKDALKSLKPSGWTPIAGALEQAKKELEKFDSEKTTNLIYLVSDGVETCDGDPVEMAKSLNESGISPIINIIGFNVDSEAQKQLKEIARISEGTYTTVNNGEQLKEEFNRAEEVLERWKEWKEDQMSDADAQRVEQSFEIMGFYSDWADTARQQFINLNTFLSIMKDEGKIDIHQMNELRSRSKEVNALAKQSKNEIREELDQLNVEKAEEIKKQINEKYKSSTSTDR